jgi:hypothetical protein
MVSHLLSREICIHQEPLRVRGSQKLYQELIVLSISSGIIDFSHCIFYNFLKGGEKIIRGGDWVSSEEKFIKEMGKINQSSQKSFDEMMESREKSEDKWMSKASDSIKESGKGIDTKDKAGLSEEAMEEKKAK